MIAFEETLKGKRVCTEGVEDFGVLSTVLTWVRRKNIPCQSARGPIESVPDHAFVLMARKR